MEEESSENGEFETSYDPLSTPRSQSFIEKPLAPGLYLVATPIGNLEDISLRALRVLRSVDRIACEDTRQTQKLLNFYGISTPTVSSHAHNEAERAPELISELLNGARIAVVSDAGTPGISDPGMTLAMAAINAGISVIPIPGANAAISALIGSGLPADRFFFAGFLPSKVGERRTELERLAALATTNHPLTLIIYEAPHRILETLGDVEAVCGAECQVVVARELTKIYEEFLRGTAASVKTELEGRDRIRGEIVLLIAVRHDARKIADAGTIGVQVAALIAEGLDEKESLKRIARERGISKSEAYREWQRERARR